MNPNFSDPSWSENWNAKGLVNAFYCIHCNRHFLGKGRHEAVEAHMRDVHHKRPLVTPGGNIRVTEIDLAVFNGVIEVCN